MLWEEAEVVREQKLSARKGPVDWDEAFAAT